MGSLGGDGPLKGDEIGRHEDVCDQVEVEERPPKATVANRVRSAAAPRAIKTSWRRLRTARATGLTPATAPGVAGPVTGAGPTEPTYGEGTPGEASTPLSVVRRPVDFLARMSITLSSPRTGADLPNDDS